MSILMIVLPFKFVVGGWIPTGKCGNDWSTAYFKANEVLHDAKSALVSIYHYFRKHWVVSSLLTCIRVWLATLDEFYNKVVVL